MSQSLHANGRFTESGQRYFLPLFLGIRAVLLLALFLFFGPAFPPVIVGFTVASFIVLLFAERWIPYRQDWRVADDPQWRNDIGHSVIYLLSNGPLIRGLLVGSLIVVLERGDARLWSGIWPDAWPMVLQVLLVVTLDDFLEYWAHRVSHTVRWLWPFHMLHHTPDRVHVLKTLRHQWPFAWVRAGCVALPILALGASLEVAAWGLFALYLMGPISHANINIQVPRWVHWALNTPDLHRIHHSIEPKAQNSNFCFAFPVWDILFGTYLPPEREEVVETGLKDDPVPDGFLRQLAVPLTNS